MTAAIKNAFIVGTGRCGTTWLAQMLNSHAEICVPPEIQLLFEYSDNGNRLFEEFSEAAPSGLAGDHLASIIERSCPHKIEMFFDYREFCLREDTPKNSLAEFVGAFYSAIAKSHGKSWLVEQTPWYGSRLDLISRFFPKAKVIHVIRDGRDVALSFARTSWWHISPRLNLARWQREIKKITVDAALYLNASTYLEVRYEDLVANTEAELRRICEFLGVEFQSAMLDPEGYIDYDQFFKFDTRKISSPAYIAWRQRKNEAVFSESVQAWQRTENLFDSPLPDNINHWLTRFGYEVPPRKPNQPGQHHPEYGSNALEQLDRSQADRIRALEASLQRQVEHTALIAEDWTARGEHINRLTEAAQKQAAHTELVVKDWTARGEMIDELARTIDALRQTSLAQDQRIELISNDWAARGAHIDQLAQTIRALTEAARKQADHADMVTKDWTARGELIDQLAHSVDALEYELNTFRNSWYGTLRRAVNKFRLK